MASLSAAEFFDQLISRAPKLREAGVLEVGFEGFHAKLAPPDPAPVQFDLSDTEDIPADPMLAWSQLPKLSRLEVLDDKAPK